jgi:hypothetical protein
MSAKKRGFSLFGNALKSEQSPPEKTKLSGRTGDKTEIPEKEYAQFIGLPEGTTFAATVLRSWGRKAREELVSLKLLRIMETPSSKTIESWMKSLEKTK